ncbi:MAG: hypothetical protein KAI95_02605, partial [Bacteroidales bacterium]|nr:hypothetical protein [Bacteroidales bacterium]
MLLKGEEVTFIFNKTINSLVDITFQETEGDLVKPAKRESSPDGNYYIEIDEQKIWFNPTSCKKRSGILIFKYNNDLFSAEISWKMAYGDAALIEYLVIPKQRVEKMSLGYRVF